MKIAVNTRFLLPNKLEGFGWYTYEVMQRLVKRHPEHEFIFLFDRAYSQEFIFGDNVRPLAVFPQARHPILFYWWFEWSLPKVFKRYGVDVFFSPDGFLSLRAQIPTLLVIHDICWKHFPEQVPYWHRKHYEHYMPKFAQKATHISTVSEYSKQDIVRHLGVSADKVSVAYSAESPLYQPIDIAAQATIRAKYTQGKPYFLYVGSIHPRKNVPRLLQAFEAFKKKSQSPVQLVLAGRMAWQTGEVGETLKGMDYQSEVHFLGYVPTAELVQVVASAYAMVYVSLFEGFGIPIADAMQAHVPVITSNTSSMPEVAGGAALLADPYSVESIAAQMLHLWAEPALRDELIDLGAQQCLQFSWDKTADSIEVAFEQMGKHL